MKRSFLVFSLLLVSMWMAFAPRAQAQPVQQSGGTCTFSCIRIGGDPEGPRGEPLPAPVRPQCTPSAASETDPCVAICEARCQVNGVRDPDAQGRATNGFDDTRGRLRCYRPASPTDANSPRCIASAVQPANTSGGQGANTGATDTVSVGGNRSGSQGTVELLNPLGNGVTSIPQLFGRIVRAFMGILGALAMFWFVWGGILWMTAEESKRSEQAQTIMKNAALGLILIFFSYGLTTMFLSLFQEVATSATPSTQSVTPPPARR